MILCDQVNVVPLRIIYDFMQPNYVWMLKSFEYLQLFFYTIICVATLTERLPLQILPIHLLNGIVCIVCDVHAEVDRCELTSAKLLLKKILINLLTLELLYSLDFSGTDDR